MELPQSFDIPQEENRAEFGLPGSFQGFTACTIPCALISAFGNAGSPTTSLRDRVEYYQGFLKLVSAYSGFSGPVPRSQKERSRAVKAEDIH